MDQGDSRFHIGMDESQLKHRNRHDTIIPVEIDLGFMGGTRRVVQQGLRVASDWRLRRMLEEGKLEGAFEAIRIYYHSIAAPSSSAFDISGVKGLGGGSRDLMISKYFEWAASVQRAKLSHAQAMDVIVFGYSLRQVDKMRRQASGKAQKNLIGCLQIWQG